jgi:hypothetical protein
MGHDMGHKTSKWTSSHLVTVQGLPTGKKDKELDLLTREACGMAPWSATITSQSQVLGLV